MAPKRFSSLPKLIVFLVIGIVLVNPFPAKSAEQAGAELTADTACRIGINSPLAVDGYDIASLGIASLLDWGAVNNPSLPDGVEYIRVLRLRDDLYADTLADLPGWVQANPGSVWVIGNEPDTTYEDQPGNGQDGLLPEVYADRYYELARIIRRLDRSAQIGFGPVVQPTPIRMRYLERAWDQLILDAGNSVTASRLVDIWVPHSFILNEEEGAWGCGIPPGFENDHDDAVIITDFEDTHSITIFQDRIIAFRLWMASIGERNKPLWITEYGSLFPPIDPPGGPDFYNVSDHDTALYMWNTFDYMLTVSDHQSGMPADGDQLVQRWFWYSLNDHRYHFGGSVYNPDYPDLGPLITQVGGNFILYQELKLVPPDLLPVDLFIKPMSYSEDPSLVNYQLDITVDNNQFEDAACGQLWVYDGDPNSGGSLIIGPLPASAFRPDYGQAAITAYWMEVEPETVHDLCVVVDSIGIEDADPENNMACYSVYLGVPSSRFLPLVHRN